MLIRPYVLGNKNYHEHNIHRGTVKLVHEPRGLKIMPRSTPRGAIQATKFPNSSRNISAKQFENWCCSFFYPRTECIQTSHWEIRPDDCSQRHLAARQVLSVVVIRAVFTSFVAKSITIFYFLQQTFSTCSRLFWCETSLYAGRKTRRIIAFWSVSQQCCEKNWGVLLFVLPCLDIEIQSQYYCLWWTHSKAPVLANHLMGCKRDNISSYKSSVKLTVLGG